MARILSIDYGTKRIGLAVTDPMQIIANGLDTVHIKDLHAYLKNYLTKEKVETIVLGWPKNLDNSDSASLKYVQEFYHWLLKNFPDIPVFKMDERFTSVLAQKAILESGIGKKARQNKGLVDKVSATILLQNYLDSKRMNTL